MQYVGSKRRIADRLLPVILEGRRFNQWYVEPFVGGANILEKVRGRRIGNDINVYLIKMLRALQAGWIPPEEVTREMYYVLKANRDVYVPELVGFVSFMCSFGSKPWGGYAFNRGGRNYAKTGVESLMKQIRLLRNVMFTSGNYWEVDYPKDSIIYCDPPYRGSINWGYTFDYDLFWHWVRGISVGGHRVFVSEYEAPDDFECLLEIPIKVKITKPYGTKVERLFRYRSRK